MAWWSEQMMERRFFPGTISSDEHRWFHQVQASTQVGPLLRMGGMLLGTDLTGRLSDIACPLWMISPDQSPFVTPDIPVEILSRVASADLAVLPHTRHGIFFSHAGDLRAVVAGVPGAHLRVTKPMVMAEANALQVPAQ